MTPNNPTLHRADWVSLKDYIDARLEALCKEIGMASEATDHRLESMNKFRELITEQNRSLMSKDEYNLAHKPIEDDVKELRDFMSKQQGKASQNSVLIGYVMSIVALLAAIALHFVK